jgi:hypothetical protein
MNEDNKKNSHDQTKIRKNDFPPRIEIQNNMLCLEKFKNYMKNVNFKFSHCCVCNEKKNHARSNNTPNIRHKCKILKNEKYFQIQSQTSYAK